MKRLVKFKNILKLICKSQGLLLAKNMKKNIQALANFYK